MPGIKTVVRKGELNSQGLSNIKLRISHKGKVRYVATPWYIDPKHMADNGLVKSSYAGQSALNRSLLACLAECNDIIAGIGTAVRHMDVNDLADRIRNRPGSEKGFASFTRERIAEMRAEKRDVSAFLYEVTLNHLLRYTNETELKFDAITPSFLKGFEKYLKANDCKINTIRNYLCNIRALFNQAIDRGAADQGSFPFRRYKIAQEPTRKRSLTAKDIRKIAAAYKDLTPARQRGVDMFMLSFYLIGTNLKDLLFARNADVYKERLIYSRFKTGRSYSIKLLPQATKIINRYRGQDLLLRFMEDKPAPGRKRSTEPYKDFLRETNKQLAWVSAKIKLPVKVSTYFARHSWASIAASAGVSRDVIAHALGHGTNTITDIYIDFDLKKIDAANRLVAGKINL